MDIAGALNSRHFLTRPVESHMSAAAVGSGGIEVLSTPWMIALMETASRDAVQSFLPPGHTTVGTRVDVRHTAPLPVGALVSVESTLIEMRDRILVFAVRAFCDSGEIGHGTHERVVINTVKFMSRLKKGV
jgi:predicted thioesterase